MHFYKAKWEAGTPTRVQINVPTNTDYRVGTELYVKGEKKDITANNVTLSDGSIILTDTNAVAPSGQTDYWTSAKPGNFNTFTFRGNVENARLYSNVKLKTVDGVQYAYAQDIDDLQITTSAGSVLKNASNSVTNIASITIDGTTYSIQAAAKSRIVDGKDGVLYYIITSTNGAVEYLDIPEGAVITSTRFYDAGTDAYVNRVGTFSMRFRYPVVYTADTTVNGIPAFTMKSLDAEADKLYDVEFKQEADIFDVSLSASSTNFQFVSLSATYVNYTTTQDITITAPLYTSGTSFAVSDNPTYLKDIRPSTGEDWFDGTTTSTTRQLIQFIIDGVTYSILPVNKTSVDNLGLKINGKSYFIIRNGSTYQSIEKLDIPAGTSVRFNRSASVSNPELYSGLVQIGEAYDYKFKLFINEDEQAYGDIQVGQEFPNTITLSGTYEDDTTFSYTIPIVED